jgi:hypothetical protein
VKVEHGNSRCHTKIALTAPGGRFMITTMGQNRHDSSNNPADYEFSVETGEIILTLKIKRAEVIQRYKKELQALYG